MGKTFEKINACSAGDFGNNSNKIPQWIKANGGQYSKSVVEGVTHLISTVEAYKKDVEAVRMAKQLQTVKIVSYDWLSDSLLSKTRKPKAEKQYLLENVVKEEKKGKSQVKKGVAKNSKEVKMKGAGKAKASAKASSRSIKTKPVASNSEYQIYMSKENHTIYSATLYRQQLSRNSREKFQLKIYETKKEPHTYTTYTKYTRTGVSKIELLAPLNSTLDIALSAFNAFFKDKTGLEWEERASTTPLLPKSDDEGNALPLHEGWFHYDERVGLLSSILKRDCGDAFDASKFK
ncbi:BRCT domain protein [Aspergillus candidus]|uniref:BRCT domain protein n=1 Tax=Aspergillus candidus TaxID=41067 RepID=A0A2I2F720_ASPCN|nr:BRCT domain protein [Aspergillus candidus]PLB36414.1 BRCT domain protein [Aspergillus candidus]